MTIVLRSSLILLALAWLTHRLSLQLSLGPLLVWGLSIWLTRKLAADLNRHVLIWTFLAIALPYLGPLALALLRRKPSNALSLVDTCWYYFERPTNRMMATGMLFFDEPMDRIAFEQVIRDRLLQHDRFRERVQLIDGFPCWVEQQPFELSRHLGEETLPDASEGTLIMRLNQLASQPLDFDEPLWHMTLLHRGDAGTVLAVRIHHCIADGIALVRVLLSLTDPAVPAEQQTVRNGPPPQTMPKTTHSRFEQVWDMLVAIGKAFIGPDSRTCLKNPLSGERTTAWSKPISLDRVKAISQRHNAKINDVVLATTAGAIRHYLQAQGETVDFLTIRVLVPINLRPLTGPIALGNKIGFVYLPLPVHLDDPVERLRAVKVAMDSIKGGQEAMLSYVMLTLLGTLPVRLQHALVDTLNNNASSTMTNVPGPREPILMAGCPIRHMIFFGPQSGPMGVGISVFSYAGEISLAINADASMVDQPELFAEYFEQSLLQWPDNPQPATRRRRA